MSARLKLFEVFDALCDETVDVHIPVQNHVAVRQSNSLFVILDQLTVANIQELQWFAKRLTSLLQKGLVYDGVNRLIEKKLSIVKL